LRRRGVGVNVHYIPVHLQPFYKNYGFKKGDFPNAERYYSRVISLPLFHGMTNTQQDLICQTLRKALR